MFELIKFILRRSTCGLSVRRNIYIDDQKSPLYVSPDAQLKYLKLGKNPFDKDLIALAQKYVNADSVVWDIGANVGVFSFSSATFVSSGSIVLFEPDIFLAGLLRKSANISNYRNKKIIVVPAAVSGNDGIAEFLIAKNGRATNSLKEFGGHATMGGVRETQHVPVYKVETLLKELPAPDVVKIDVEGAEEAVLRNASTLLKSIRPIIILEVSKDTFGGISELMAEHNYTMVGLDGEVVAQYPGIVNIVCSPLSK